LAQRARALADTRAFMTLSAAGSTLVLGAICGLAHARVWGFPPESWAALLGLGLISHLGGWLLINYFLGHMRAAVVSVGLLGQAVVTAVLSDWLLKERPDRNQIAGGLLVLLGVYVVNRGKSAIAPKTRAANGD